MPCTATEHEPSVAFYDDPEHDEELALDVREAALGATARVPDKPDTWEGWEDSAVPPERLGDYLRDFCDAARRVRLRAPPPCTGTSARAACTPGSRSTWSPPRASPSSGGSSSGPPTWCVSYGGSLSGEHGDGQSRGELLPRMFGDELVRAFGEIKAVFDPDDRMNPGKVVAPYRLDENLRLGAAGRRGRPRHLLRATRTTTAASRRAVAALRGRRQVPAARASGGGDVPVATWSPARRSTPPAAGRGCCSRCSRGRRPITGAAGGPPRSATPSTCAWPARAARPTARSTSTWRPTRRSSWPTTTRAGCARVRTTRWAGCPLWPGSPPRAPARSTRSRRRRSLGAAAPSGRRHRPAPRAAALRPGQRFTPGTRSRGARRAGLRGEVLLWPDTFTNQLPPDDRARPRSRCWSGRVRVDRAAAAAVLRADLDLDRPARRRPAGCCGAPSTRWRRTCRPDGAGGRAGAELHGGVPLRRAELSPATEDVRPAGASRPSRSPSCSASTADGSGPAAGALARRKAIAQTHCHQHADHGLRRRPELLRRARRRRGRAGRGLLRAGRQLRLRARPLRGVGGLRRAGAAARRAGRRTQPPSSSPTGSAAAPRSRPAISAGRGSTSPSCSPGCSVRIRTAERTGPRTGGELPAGADRLGECLAEGGAGRRSAGWSRACSGRSR